jgi:hypothetical protein
VQRLCNAGTTGKKNEVTAKAIARAAAIVSFLANEVTDVGSGCGHFGRTRKPSMSILLYDVRINQSGKFEHVNFFLAVKDSFQSFIGFDELFLLKVILFNVLPKFFGEFSPWYGIFANNPGERGIRLYWLHERAFCFTFV